MAISKATEYTFLPDSAFTAEARGHNDLIRSLTGRTRHEYELATGENPHPQEPPASRLNPDARLGHNHRGPPWGSAFLHPVAWQGGKKDSAGNIQGTRHPLQMFGGGGHAAIANWVIYVPPFTSLPLPAIAPYSRLRLHMVAHITVAGFADLTMLIRARPLNSPPVSEFRTFTETVSSTTETAFDYLDSNAPDFFVETVPGYNVVDIRIANNDAASKDCIIDSISLGQQVKRSH